MLFLTSVAYSFPTLSVPMLRYTVLLNDPNMFRNIFLVHGKLLLDNSTVKVLCCLYVSSLLDVQVFLSKFKHSCKKQPSALSCLLIRKCLGCPFIAHFVEVEACV